MKKHHKIWSQCIPITLEKAWDYFSRPEHLNEITPPDFQIKMTEKHAERELQAGLKIHYKLKPIFGLSMGWTTRITEVEYQNSFTYEQEKGPYALWRHEHYFQEVENGIVMTDKLTYAMKWGKAGEWINHLIIDRRIETIFDFRQKKIRALFGVYDKSSSSGTL